MSTRLQSRAWSCSELVRGAAQVVDEMPAPSLNEMVVSEKHRLLGETSDLSADDIEKLLQDPCMTNFIQSRDYCQKNVQIMRVQLVLHFRWGSQMGKTHYTIDRRLHMQFNIHQMVILSIYSVLFPQQIRNLCC